MTDTPFSHIKGVFMNLNLNKNLNKNYKRLVLFLVLLVATLQIIIFSPAQATTNLTTNLTVSLASVSLTSTEIKLRPKQKQIEYFKKIRALMVAAEEAQNALLNSGADFYVAARQTSKYPPLSMLFDQLLGKAWAQSGSVANCIIAGNVGVVAGRYCDFDAESKARNAACGPRKAACNPNLYGDNICIDFKSRHDKAHATANCNKKDLDFSHVLAKYNTIDANSALNNLMSEAQQVFAHCMSARKSKKITPDQSQTCNTLEERVNQVGNSACHEVKNQALNAASTDPLLKTRIKACQEIEKGGCESQANRFEAEYDKLNKACNQSGYANNVNGGLNRACYRDIVSCEKNGHDSTYKVASDNFTSYEKCFSTKKIDTLEQLDAEVAKSNARASELKQNIAELLKKCLPKNQPIISFDPDSSETSDLAKYDRYKNFLKLDSFNSQDVSLTRALSVTGSVTSQAEEHPLGDFHQSSAHDKEYAEKINKRNKRKAWNEYLNKVSSKNEKSIKSAEADLKACDLEASQKEQAQEQLRELRYLNKSRASQYRHNADIATKTENSGLLDTAEVRTENKANIEQWFNNGGAPSHQACCVGSSSSGGTGAYLKDNKWCNKMNSGFASQVYNIPETNNSYQEVKPRSPVRARENLPYRFGNDQ